MTKEGGRSVEQLLSDIDDAAEAAAEIVARRVRIIVDHIYHRIDYGIVWTALEHDIPHLRSRLQAFRGR